jgi:hypothetical protein
MDSTYLIPTVTFVMKYFFDLEKETTMQLLNTAHLRLLDLKEIFIHYAQFMLQK